MAVNKYLKRFIPVMIVLVAITLSYGVVTSTGGKSQRIKPANKKVRVVKTEPLIQGDSEPFWDSSGIVKAKESVKIYSRVAGYVESTNINATPGHILNKGDWLVHLEEQDLILDLKNQQALLQQAQSNLALEQAEQKLAKEELSLLNQNVDLPIDEALVLRQPQSNVANAKLAIAKTNVEKAQLNLTRAKTLMPFNGQVLEKHVSQGSKISPNTALFTVVNSDAYWLEAKVPVSFRRLLDVNKTVRLTDNKSSNNQRSGRIISILPDLDSKDRQLKVLIEINDPLALTSDDLSAFYLNSFLHVRLYGKQIKNAWQLKYHWLQPDQTIWVVDKANTLQKRAIEVEFKGRDYVHASGDFLPGDIALAEKPGIATVGLPVKVKRSGQALSKSVIGGGI